MFNRAKKLFSYVECSLGSDILLDIVSKTACNTLPNDKSYRLRNTLKEIAHNKYSEVQ